MQTCTVIITVIMCCSLRCAVINELYAANSHVVPVGYVQGLHLQPVILAAPHPVVAPPATELQCSADTVP